MTDLFLKKAVKIGGFTIIACLFSALATGIIFAIIGFTDNLLLLDISEILPENNKEKAIAGSGSFVRYSFAVGLIWGTIIGAIVSVSAILKDTIRDFETLAKILARIQIFLILGVLVGWVVGGILGSATALLFNIEGKTFMELMRNGFFWGSVIGAYFGSLISTVPGFEQIPTKKLKKLGMY